jgi:polysaccharide biosynthesis protein PslJ
VTAPQTVPAPPEPASQDDLPAKSQSLGRRWRRTLSGTDGTTVLTAYIAMLLLLPARYVFAPLGAAGTPAQMIAIVIALWWGSHWMSRTKARKLGRQPVTRTMLLFTTAVLISYIVATTRSIDTLELNATDRSLLSLLGWLGVVLVAGTLIPVRHRLDQLLRRTVTFGTLLAALGDLQFLTGRTFTEYLQIPGLSENEDLTSVLEREGLNRAAGTAVHPIEFGVVITMLLPIALHFAVHDLHRPAWRRWLPVAVIAMAIPASVSRSSILCGSIVMGFLLPTWETMMRRLAYLALVVGGGLVFVGVPGMLGTLLQLFSGISEDSSARSRTDSYGVAVDFISRTPMFGRGFSTFLPAYRILDNQYLGSLIEVGVFGVLSLLGLFITGILSALLVRHRSHNPNTRSLALSLAAAISAGATSFAFFDAFAFSMISGLMFYLLGMINALYSLQSQEGRRIASNVSRNAASPATGAIAIAALQLDPSDFARGTDRGGSARHVRSGATAAGEGMTHQEATPGPPAPR